MCYCFVVLYLLLLLFYLIRHKEPLTSELMFKPSGPVFIRTASSLRFLSSCFNGSVRVCVKHNGCDNGVNFDSSSAEEQPDPINLSLLQTSAGRFCRTQTDDSQLLPSCMNSFIQRLIRCFLTADKSLVFLSFSWKSNRLRFLGIKDFLLHFPDPKILVGRVGPGGVINPSQTVHSDSTHFLCAVIILNHFTLRARPRTSA